MRGLQSQSLPQSLVFSANHSQITHPTSIWKHMQFAMKAILEYSGTPLTRSPMGQKNLAILMTVFYQKMYGCFARQLKNVAVITRWPYYWSAHKVGFHCTINVQIAQVGLVSSSSHFQFTIGRVQLFKCVPPYENKTKNAFLFYPCTSHVTQCS